MDFNGIKGGREAKYKYKRGIRNGRLPESEEKKSKSSTVEILRTGWM